MTTKEEHERNCVFLQAVEIQTESKKDIRLTIVQDGNKFLLRPDLENRVWTPLDLVKITPSNFKLAFNATSRGYFSKHSDVGEIDLHLNVDDLRDKVWASVDGSTMHNGAVEMGRHVSTYVLTFRGPHKPQDLRDSIQRMDQSLEKLKDIMGASTVQTIDKLLKVGVAISEVDPRAKAVVSVVKVLFEMVKKQTESDDKLRDILDIVQRLEPCTTKIVERNDTSKDLERVLQSFYELVVQIGEYCCDYVQRKRFARAMSAIFQVQPQVDIANFDQKLKKIIQDLDRSLMVDIYTTVNDVKDAIVETNQRLLLERLWPFPNKFHSGFVEKEKCMHGTRERFIERVVSWANVPIPTSKPYDNLFWIYGLPGSGKTAVANSIASRMHTAGTLTTSFFCRRDDPHLSKVENVLPALLCAIATVWRDCGERVATMLKADPNLTTDTFNITQFLDILRSSGTTPSKPLIIVLDGLDECGSAMHRSRPALLDQLISLVSEFSWFRIIVTSRPEEDIRKQLDPVSVSCDIMEDGDTEMDLEKFAQVEFQIIAIDRHLAEDGQSWPSKEVLDAILKEAKGLFIYIKSIILVLTEPSHPTPTEFLNEIAKSNSNGTSLHALYSLYSKILQNKIDFDREGFHNSIGVIIATLSTRPLTESAIAQLAGVKESSLATWVDRLGSLFLRNSSRELQARHLSVLDFFTSLECPDIFRIDILSANANLGLACLMLVFDELPRTAQNLDSYRRWHNKPVLLANEVQLHLSETLRYSCLFWTYHVTSNSTISLPLVTTLQQTSQIFIFATIMTAVGKLISLQPTDDTDSLAKYIRGLEKERRKSLSTIIGHTAKLAYVLETIGQFKEAEMMGREVLRLQKVVLGVEHPDTITAMSRLATTLHSLGQFQDAGMLRREVLRLEKKVHGLEHSCTITAMHNLALTLQSLGQLKEAEMLQHDVLRFQKAAHGDQHPKTIEAMQSSAGTLEALGKFKEAEKIQREVLEFRKTRLGDEHPDTIGAMHNVAGVIFPLGQFKEAKDLWQEVLRYRKMMLGAKHPDTLGAMTNVASSLASLGELKEAELMRREVLELSKEVLGPQNPKTILAMNNLALNLHSLGQFKEARELQEQVLRFRKATLGDKHKDTIAAKANLAGILKSLGQLKEAEIMQHDVLQFLKDTVGDQHRDTLVAMQNAAGTLQTLGRSEEAEAMYREVLKHQKAMLGDEHPDTIGAMHNLAMSLASLGRLKEAETMQREVSRLWIVIGSDQHPRAISSMAGLAGTLHRLRRWAEAETMKREVLALREEMFGDEHPDTIMAMNNLALTLYSSGQLKKVKEAELMLRKALPLCQEVLGDTHPLTITVKGNLTDLLLSQLIK